MEELRPGGRTCRIYGSADAKESVLIVQPVDNAYPEDLKAEYRALTGGAEERGIVLAGFGIGEWNRELTPWDAPAVFGKDGFGHGAEDTLRFLLETLLPALEDRFKTDFRSRILCGYSLAGLFALWASYRTAEFDAIAAVSPSVWYPGWDGFMSAHAPLAQRYYLSLGDAEERTKNRTMAAVGARIRLQQSLLETKGKQSVLRWNPGNHFREPEVRVAKGLRFLISGSEDQ